MALIVEPGTGLINADSYMTIAEADTYHLKHGNPSAWTDAKAIVDLIISAQPSDGDTFTIGTKTFTLQAALTNADGNILINTDIEITKKNIVDSINGNTSNIEIAPLTTSHPDVESTGFVGTLINVTALIGGIAGNLIVSTSTFTDNTNTFSTVTLIGGSDDKELALRLGTQYLDNKYTLRWIGHQQNRDQSLDWPRNAAQKRNGFHVDASTVPTELKDALAEMALKSISGTDIFDIDETTTGAIKSFTNKVSVLSQSKTFVGGGQVQVKKFRKVDSLLKQLLNPKNEVRRS